MARSKQQTFKNKRAQYYWALRDRFYNTWRAVVQKEYINPEKLISLSSDIKHLVKLKAEICRIPRKYNSNGLFQVMDKKEMASARLKIPSPNLADGTKMTLFLGEEKEAYAGGMPGGVSTEVSPWG